MRTNDGSEPSEVNYYLGRYERRTDSLRWRPTGPFYGAKPGPAFSSFDRGLAPGHGRIKPWTMKSGSQFLTPDFYDPKSPEFAEEFDRIRRIGGMDSAIRTADQSEIALFWEDGPWGITPPGHMIYIAMQILQDRGLSFIELARALALVGMTQCDASISAWDAKYHHDVLRPETAIRMRAPKFANPDSRVVRQPDWSSFIPTPEFPAYPAGHSTFGAAAAEMIALIHGRRRRFVLGPLARRGAVAATEGRHQALEEPRPHGGRKRHEPHLRRRSLGDRPHRWNEGRPGHRATGVSFTTFPKKA